MMDVHYVDEVCQLLRIVTECVDYLGAGLGFPPPPPRRFLCCVSGTQSSLIDHRLTQTITQYSPIALSLLTERKHVVANLSNPIN